MASASTTIGISITLGCSGNEHHLLLCQPRNRINVALPLHSSSSLVTFSRRRSNSANSAITSSKEKKKSSPRKDTEEVDDIDEDAFDALFQLLEEDLKNDDLSLNDDDDITEEDLAKLECELEEALKDDELLGEIDSIVNEKIESSKAEDEEAVAEDANEEDEDEEILVKLKNWQLKKLAYALRKGRRKLNNAMISSIVHVTNLPRKRVLKWFEDRRSEQGVPDHRLPYEPSSIS